MHKVLFTVAVLCMPLAGCKSPEGGDFDAPFGDAAPAWAREDALPRWAGDFAFVKQNNSGHFPAGVDDSPVVLHVKKDLSVHFTFTRENGRRASCTGRLDDSPDDRPKVSVQARCRYAGSGDASEELRDEVLRLDGHQIIDQSPMWFVWDVDLDRLDVGVALYSCRNNPSKCERAK